MNNDQDATGETYSWTSVAAGEYKVSLEVEDNSGLTDVDDSLVYINYRGEWYDFELDRLREEKQAKRPTGHSYEK